MPSEISHDGLGIYAGLPKPLVAGRYHSLFARRDVDTYDAICDHLLVLDHAARDGASKYSPLRLLQGDDTGLGC